jgi:hypothetical protein
LNRQPELVSGSIAQQLAFALVERWILKQVQHDVVIQVITTCAAERDQTFSYKLRPDGTFLTRLP